MSSYKDRNAAMRTLRSEAQRQVKKEVVNKARETVRHEVRKEIIRGVLDNR